MTGSEPVPSISEWGLAVLTLLLLSAGTIVFARRRNVMSRWGYEQASPDE